MNEPNRIAALFSDLYDGDPWIDINLAGTLQKISAATAAKKIQPGANSIWEIVNHIIGWRQQVLQRVKGQGEDSPGNNYFSPVADQSANAWQQTLQALQGTQVAWLQFLQELDAAELEKLYSPNSAGIYKNIQGIIQHDAYHLGQIVLLLKYA